jgi:hypothetical protein
MNFAHFSRIDRTFSHKRNTIVHTDHCKLCTFKPPFWSCGTNITSATSIILNTVGRLFVFLLHAVEIMDFILSPEAYCGDVVCGFPCSLKEDAKVILAGLVLCEFFLHDLALMGLENVLHFLKFKQ